MEKGRTFGGAYNNGDFPAGQTSSGGLSAPASARSCAFSGGLNDAIFCALPLIHADEEVVVAPLDSVWFPEDALCALPRGILSFLLPRAQSDTDQTVVMDDYGYVREIRSDAGGPGGAWTWRAFKAPVRVLRELHTLWLRRDRRDTEIESLVNEHFRRGGHARGVRAGASYLRFDSSPSAA